MIYIDPPYNTEATKNDGNSIANDKENVQATKFVYRDKYSRNGWLNLMNERLKLAKELLKDDGVIFVSIDDAEQAYLKVLMDEIFGEENFIANFIIDKTAQGANNSQKFKTQHEYCIFYKKHYASSLNAQELINIDEKKYKFRDEKGFYAITNSFDSINSPLSQNKNRGYTIYFNESKQDIILKDEYDVQNNKFWDYDNELISKNYVPIRPGIRNKIQYPWNWSKERFLREYDKELVFKNKNGKYAIYHKNRFTSYITDTTIKKFDTRKFGNKILNDILNSKKFQYPKSVEMLKWILTKHINKNAKVLDFFAGSGTTAHAVLDLNKEDGGNRTFTLVTNNENNIGIDVNYERLYRINHGIGTKGESFEWTNKNEPYKSNLNVYNIKYYDISLFNNIDVKEIVKELIKLLKDFGVNSLSEESKKDYTNLLNSLLSLKPQLKENNESN
ncbi:site-specific DNA-methyltransferase [Mycoplasmopsis canis]|uniref:site-specific DNA-methyltransferase n=1 Tax=Mycoplasmopsis cynos TaxID=171284 RepID=UPI002AFF88FB|nr:site-specific DNA-methyltransferase [Mycoplasmopsis cynos]WQQ13527.1 site-specific DNA-methyltransferase [Mycoplasmopsis cynos]WQQ14314.1 site-specific DNA-methyltransferase [Mycoplasmopsis cynos]